MKTFVPKKAEGERKWYLVDANGKTLGRIATEIAKVLRGKNKPEFTPHLDLGDGVVVINAEKINLSTQAKWDQKKYYSHSGYVGNLKEISAKKLLEKKPTEILRQAVVGMIPKNKLKADMTKRLRIFSGAEHTLQSQKPEALTL